MGKEKKRERKREKEREREKGKQFFSCYKLSVPSQ